MSALLKRTKTLGAGRQSRHRKTVEMTVDGAALTTLLPSDAKAMRAYTPKKAKQLVIGKETRRAQIATLEAAIKRVKTHAQVHPPRNLGHHSRALETLTRELERLKGQQQQAKD